MSQKAKRHDFDLIYKILKPLEAAVFRGFFV